MKKFSELDKYINGGLTPKEKLEFENRLNHDEELQGEYKLHLEIEESIKDEDIVAFRKKAQTLIIEKAPNRKRIITNSSFIVAALFIVGFSLVSIFTSKPHKLDKAYSAYYKPYVTDLSTRSNDSRPEGWEVALKFYQEKAYEASFEILENYNNVVYDNPYAKFHYAICALELNKLETAQENLLELLQSDNEAIKLHSKWYIAMLYIRKEQANKAVVFLKELANSDNFYSDRASELLKKHF